MPNNLDTLQEEALKLSAEERAKLADRLLASIFEDHEIEAAWADEVERRIAEIDSGAVKPIPASEAIARARAALK